jgi:DUF971 family protein
MPPRPSRISASRSRSRLTIEWDDGHRSEYSFSGLRAACPCAQCRGEGSLPLESDSSDPLRIPLLPAASADLVEMHQAGNYALQLVWKDGHRSGIYPWEYLRRLCPCADHRTGKVV